MIVISLSLGRADRSRSTRSFREIGRLYVNKLIEEKANPGHYIGVLVPGGAKSPAILSKSEAVLAFLRHVNGERKLVAPTCRGTLLVAHSGLGQEPSRDRLSSPNPQSRAWLV